MGDYGVDSGGVVMALLLLALFLGGGIAMRGRGGPALSFSHLASLREEGRSLRERLSTLPRRLQIAAFIFFCAALFDIHSYKEKGKEGDSDGGEAPLPKEGIAIYLVLDNSRSMGEEIDVTEPSGMRKRSSKMELLKEVTEKFVRGEAKRGLRGRANDLLGVVTFARSATVLSPLTLDHGELLRQLQALEVNRDDSQLGTALGYAIFKTANLIAATRHYGEESLGEGEASYEIKNSVIVLITDGFQETNPDDYDNPLRNMDLQDAVESVRESGITLYIINIDPSINSERYSDNRRYFSLLTAMTGGKFYTVGEGRTLEKIYREIDQLEKSELPHHSIADKKSMPHLYQRESLSPTLILLALIALFLSHLLDCTYLRRIP